MRHFKDIDCQRFSLTFNAIPKYIGTSRYSKCNLSNARLHNSTELQINWYTINFANRARAANTINSWVSQKTHGKIENLISPDALNGLTRLVLVNAIYFKGNWVHRFTYTNDGPFYPNGCNDASAITTKMMHVTVSAKIIDIPSQFIIKICSLNLYF